VKLPTWAGRDLDASLPDRWNETHIARCAALGIPVPPNPKRIGRPREADRGHGKSQDLRRSVLLLPASAERAVELHKTLVLRAARLREREFSGKERPLAVQDFEIGRGTPLVPHVG
jgi:hypothetical protein